MINVSSQKPKSLGDDDNMIPLINIVFLMLIFFMVAGHIEKTDNLNVELPLSESNTEINEQVVKLYIDQTGLMQLDTLPIAQDSLTRQLAATLESSPSADSVHLLVQVDSGFSAVELQRILLDVKASGIRRVSLATLLKSS
jgi:biopolymer transport protein ExbD